MAWFILLLAGVFEVLWAVGLKWVSAGSAGTRILALAFVGITLAASVLLLAKAAQTIPLGTAYAVWVGIGAAGVAAVGMIKFNEPASIPRLACIALVIAGVIGLKLLGSARPEGAP